MRILVTGGAGFVGSNLSDALIAAGHSVLVMDNLSRGCRQNVPAKAEFAKIDVTTPEAERVVADYAPEALLHFAAQIDVRASVGDPAFDAQSNVVATVRLLSAAVRAKTRTFILASSGGAIYGEQETFPAAESHPTRPESPYGLSKLCGELYCDYFVRTTPVRTVALRFGNIYGPRQDPHGEAGVVAIFAQKMLRGEVPTVNGDGGQTRDYVFVDDVVAATVASLTNSQARGAYNIGTGIETDVNTLARQIQLAVGYKGEIRHGPAKPGEQRRSALDARRAKDELGWRPTVDFHDGVRRTVAWFRKSADDRPS
jgi:UDP-glucose 4-epimerase